MNRQRPAYSEFLPKLHEFFHALEVCTSAHTTLQAHLFVEQALAIAVERALPVDGKHDFVFNLGFRDRVDLGFALGVLPESYRQPYFELNKLRNQFAHVARRYFSAENADRLYNSLPPSLRAQLDAHGRNPAGCDTSDDFLTVWCALLIEATIALVDSPSSIPTEPSAQSANIDDLAKPA